MGKDHEFLNKVRDHRHRLEQRMGEHMEMDEKARNTSSLGDMIECWKKLHCMEDELCHCTLTQEETHHWMQEMENADGTSGAHWTKEQTSAVAKSTGVLMSHITPDGFWAAMNMMYSDYSAVADKFNVNKPEFFAELAKAFLFDKDGPGPEEKLAAYYKSVVCDD